MEPGHVVDELLKLLGCGKVCAGLQERLAYATDMYPRNQVLKLGKQLPDTLPVAVVFPEEVEELVQVLRFCRQEGIPVVPYGAGSGVCGSAVPVQGGVALDVKRLCRVPALDEERGRVTVEAGTTGEWLEEWLNARGWTLGHFPSSLACSTVGGYVACRSAGQYSSRYGKIEDMTLGLEVALPSGEVHRFGALSDGSHLDPLLDLFLGSEGTLGVVTRVCLRVHRLPEKTEFRGFAFADVAEGLSCMQKVMQAGVRPTVLRLYDQLDSLIAGFHGRTAGGEDVHQAASRLSGLQHTVATVLTELNQAGMALVLLRPEALNRLVEILPVRPLLIAGVQGDRGEVERQWSLVRRQAEALGGEDLGPEPGQAWLKRRYAVSYKQSKVFAAGAFVDTMEVATTWDNVRPLYAEVARAMAPSVFVMAHFSHAYEEGCSIYFTFAGYRPSNAAALSLYQKAWRKGLDAALRSGATISHHHGTGLLKRGLLDRECPGGRELFAAFKKTLDPAGVMNPGKLYEVD
jgi:alkyldihydroxyacetonephosphate synthase